MKKLWVYFLYEFISNIRTKEVIIWALIFPLIIYTILVSIFGNIATPNKEIKIFRYTIIHKDSFYGNFVNDFLKQIPILQKKDTKNLSSAIDLLKRGKLDVVISQNKKNMDIYYVEERSGSKIAGKIIESLFNELQYKFSLIFNYIKHILIKSPKPTQYKIKGLRYKEEKTISYKDYFFIGVLLMSVLTLGIFNVPEKITFYREKGILKKFFTTPLTSTTLFLGNFLSLLVIGIIQYTILATFAVLIIKVNINVLSFKMILYAFITFLFSYTLGFAIISFAKKPQEVAMLNNAIFHPLQFLGGLYFPITSVPWFIKWITIINPLTYISSAMRDMEGITASLYPTYLSFLVPILWIIILSGLIIYKFSWIEE